MDFPVTFEKIFVMPDRTEILNHEEALLKLNRIAYEIVENNLDHKEIVLLGIHERGCDMAGHLKSRIQEISKLKVHLGSIRINKSEPLQCLIEAGFDVKGKAVIVVDDVANSGRTALYAMRPLLETLPAKIQLAVLVDRRHKQFPVTSDFVGIQLSTDLHQEIIVERNREGQWSAYMR